MNKIVGLTALIILLLVNVAAAESRQPTPTPSNEPIPETTNFTVLERYPDGQPKHANMVTTKLGYERFKDYEIWWNSYGQVLKMVAYNDQKKIEWGLERTYRQELDWLNDPNAESRMPKHLRVYFDESGELVGYSDVNILPKEFSVASNKTPLPVPKWNDISTDAKAYKENMGVSNEYLFDVRNYDKIYNWVYQQTPEYQQKRIKTLESQLDNIYLILILLPLAAVIFYLFKTRKPR